MGTLTKYASEISGTKDRMLEMMLEKYLQATELSITEVVLVQEQLERPKVGYRFYFARIK